MSIEKKYQKLTDREHLLVRPSMYIGSVKPHTSEKFVIGEDGKIVVNNYTIVPGFLKLFDEIILNSVDEGKREGSNLNTIKVYVKDNQISIFDNGGIPVVKHKDHNEWIPEMIFSNMKAGSNFDDTEEREVAGTNGVGSTCTNIFSKEFILSTSDGSKSFYQVFSDNMSSRTEPVIKKSSKKYTEITYTPDYVRFGLDGLDESHLKLIERRVYDVAGTNPNLKVFYNDKLITFKSFEEYIKLYTNDFIFEKDAKWSLGVSKSNEGFKQVSYVNSVDTYDGGTHVDYIVGQITTKLQEYFKKKHKVQIKPSEIKNHLFIYLNTTIVNSLFGSQTKEKLITEPKDFGHQFKVSEKFIKKILDSEIVKSILDWIERKKDAEESKLARELTKSKVKVDKLIDCQSTNRRECSLIIMEGLSALGDFRKYRDPQKQAAYTLRGKFVNTRKMSNTKILLNEEAKGLINSLGLDLLKPNDISRLRYGKIIIATDADTDGDSICGLLLNFFSKWRLLFDKGIIHRLMAPLLVTKHKKTKVAKYFYTMEEYEQWSSSVNVSDYEIDYKKGLGSLETEEFRDLITKPKLVSFKINTPEDFDLFMENMETWFGDDSKLRKDKLL